MKDAKDAVAVAADAEAAVIEQLVGIFNSLYAERIAKLKGDK